VVNWGRLGLRDAARPESSSVGAGKQPSHYGQTFCHAALVDLYY
jgi:hypothetical protein